MAKLVQILAAVALACPMLGQAQNLETPDSISAIQTDFPTVSPYFFQHQYLSVVAPMIADQDGYILEDPEILNTISPEGNGFCSPFKDEDIRVDKVIDDGMTVYVWTFPRPQHMREALYMAFFPVDGCYKAVAISIGQLVDWEISTSNQNSRSTYGRIKLPANAQECVKLLKERNADKAQITPGEFLQEGYTPPEANY